MSTPGKRTIAASSRFEAEPIKGSRFIVDLEPVDNEGDALSLLARVRTDFGDASHHCSAWRLATPVIERANDDGEPSGSAGRPMLAQLAGRELVDIAAVITRYFGGTKLGVGGLVRAYGGALAQALDHARLVAWVQLTELSFAHQYPATDAIERAIEQAGGLVSARDFGSEVTTRARIPLDQLDRFAVLIADATSGAVLIDRSPQPD